MKTFQTIRRTAALGVFALMLAARLDADVPSSCESSGEAYKLIADRFQEMDVFVERGDLAGACAAVRAALMLTPAASAKIDACLADTRALGIPETELRPVVAVQEILETFRDDAATMFPLCDLDPLAE